MEKLLQKIAKIMEGSMCMSFEPTVCKDCEKRAKKIIKVVKAK